MIGDFLKNSPNGKISMMRVATLLVVTSIMSVWIAQNIVAMFKGCGFVSMGSEEAMLIAMTLGAKAVQHWGESRGKASPSTTDDIPVGKGQ